MKIGILSMQRVPNYGSFLQAFSLKKQFEKRGHSVYFIDILTGRKVCNDTAPSPNLLHKLDKYFFKRISNVFFYRHMNKIHTADYNKYLENVDTSASNEKFDLVVIGSDEVFNASIPSKWGFTSQLFGDVKNADRVVTYAASCGSMTFEISKELGITDEIRTAMMRLEHISVRDINTSDFVEQIIGKRPILNVDPVFISDFDNYIPKMRIRRKPYLLVYAYGNRICEEQEIRAIKAYAKKNKLDIISVGMQQRWCSHNIAANAFELLHFVKNAAFIVTDTFHGTVFSIKYNKQFAALVRESNKNKLEGLLKQFSLNSRIASDAHSIETILNTKIDYGVTNAFIAAEQQRAYNYIDMITQEE